MFVLPRLASADTVIARCSDEWEGAVFKTVSLDAEEIGFTIGHDLAPPPGPDAVLIMRDNAPPVWSRRAPRSIHATCGGKGEPILDLFGPEVARNGLWLAKLTGTTVEGCPPEAAAAASGASGANAQNIVWPQPFSPAPLMAGHGTWHQTGMMRWRGVIDQQTSEAGSVSVVVTIHVLSDTEMIGTSVMTLRLPPLIAQLVGSSGTCQSTTTATYNWQG